ncbi:MAG: cysteine desulfurase family protein [Patescibacteria group bacterium]
MNLFFPQKRIFLDYASTTPVLPEVLDAMKPFFKDHFANPSAIYKEGMDAKKAVGEARHEIAGLLGVRKEEIFFTGSGTESCNLAILGVVNSYKGNRPPHIITSTIEHPAVAQALQAVEKMGGRVTYLEPTEEGIVSAEAVAEALTKDTILVSIMYANNEIGTVQPIKEIGKVIREYRNQETKEIYFHTDASQAANYFSISPARLGVDLLTLDATKIYGPKGVGLLYIKDGVRIVPITYGGGQEGGLRSGTENVAGIVGMAKAFSIVQKDAEKESSRLTILRDYCIKNIKKSFPRATLNGGLDRLPNNINFCFPGIDSEFAVLSLDAEGIAVSAASSCRTLAKNHSSYVIEAIHKHGCSSSSLRFTLGRDTKKKDIDFLIHTLIRRIRE